ncbi:flagellar filament capping protein FliD [Chitinibacter bivalviorum]|uniref:Flagellar filament capping protein FliD n=1 Tax=Chitinibacter bivalviorum TaxID=2739434 RepID=A0A7H9BFF9_9NEIS|nr:flagellar filament capping protein FliD [Chitinibacter bivalviorum]QLG87307.1 flagellar filament capping protein FliD [Chitinibacter bivalviorum]
MSINTHDLKQLAQQIALFKTQTVSALAKPQQAFDIASLASGYLATQQSGQVAASNTTTGISATSTINSIGRNLALPDPESAYQMMSYINQLGVIYPAQSARLSDMQTGVDELAQAATSLSKIDATADFASVKTQLQNLADQYNQWRRNFDADLQDPEILASTQAAQVARYELAQSIASPFHGAQQGIQGMAVLGLTIDPVTNMAQLDTQKLSALWQQQPAAAAAAVSDFASHFAHSATLLTEQNNFFAKQQANLAKVINYMDSNKTKLQQEFGLGDPPQVSAKLAQAFADYQRRQQHTQ